MIATLTLLSHLVLAPVQDALPRRGTLGAAFAPLPPDQATKLKLNAGEGIVVQSAAPGLTADKAGLKAGDIITQINGTAVKAQGFGLWARELPSGKEVTFTVSREGKDVTLKGILTPKASDPGNENYSVTYSHIVSNGHRMRTIITTPKKPGKHKAMFFIQGFSPISYDYTLATSTGDVSTIDGPILFDIANSGYVTMRVEKPGVGDSEGGPFAPMDYTTELDIYRQALKQLKSLDSVKTDEVFIFGHSMGGSFGPMVAAENPVRGIAVYGTAGRTWFEYLMDTIRYQGLVAGQSFEAADDDARQGALLMSMVMLQKKSPEDVKKEYPKLADVVDSYFPGGLFNGKSLDFWRQLADINFASYWAKLDCDVLTVKGAADFVVYEADHKLIADLMNRKKAGKGKFIVLPNSDHLFHNFATEQDSIRNFQRGKFNADFAKVFKNWVDEVLAAKN